MKLNIALTPNNVTKLLLKLIGGLLVANLLSVYLKWERGLVTGLGIVPLFDFDQEFNIPTLYSALALLFSAALLWLIGVDENAKGHNQTRYWKVFSLAFIFLSLDELTSIHNRLGQVTGFVFKHSSVIAEEAFISSSRFWLIPYIPLLLLFLIFFSRFYLRLPKQTKVGFLIAGITFVAGAIGVELLGDRYMYTHSEPDIYYGLLYTLEELLEMVGIVLFIRALMVYIALNLLNSDINIQIIFHSAQSDKNIGFRGNKVSEVDYTQNRNIS